MSTSDLSPVTKASEKTSWPLHRILLLVLACGYLTLMADIRVEHADRFHKFWQAWIPIYYSSAMILACLIGTLGWSAARGNVRRVVFWLFVLGFAVGGYGMYMHNGADIGKLLKTLVDAWITRIHHDDVPPQLAPAAFCGLGLIGMLACSRRLQPRN